MCESEMVFFAPHLHFSLGSSERKEEKKSGGRLVGEMEKDEGSIE